MFAVSIWHTRRTGPYRRVCQPVTAKSRRAGSSLREDQQNAEALRLLWLAIGRDPGVQCRVLQLLEEVQKEVGYAPPD